MDEVGEVQDGGEKAGDAEWFGCLAQGRVRGVGEGDKVQRKRFEDCEDEAGDWGKDGCHCWGRGAWCVVRGAWCNYDGNGPMGVPGNEVRRVSSVFEGAEVRARRCLIVGNVQVLVLGADWPD